MGIGRMLRQEGGHDFGRHIRKLLGFMCLYLLCRNGIQDVDMDVDLSEGKCPAEDMIGAPDGGKHDGAARVLGYLKSTASEGKQGIMCFILPAFRIYTVICIAVPPLL